MALGGRRLLDGLLRLLAGARHKAGQRLEQECEDDSRYHVRLAEVEGRQPEVVPQLAQPETERGGEKHWKVSTPAVAQRRIEDLRRDENEQDRHHHARRDHVHEGAPSGPRGWVVLSMLRWVPCPGFSTSRPGGHLVGRPDSGAPINWLLGNAHVTRRPLGDATNVTRASSGERPLCGARRAALDPQRWGRRA